MSWRTGTSLLLDIWPIVKETIKDDEHRKIFGKDLVSIFLEHDIDAYDIDGVDPELDAIVVSIYDD
jgi:hypothetical protein